MHDDAMVLNNWPDHAKQRSEEAGAGEAVSTSDRRVPGEYHDYACLEYKAGEEGGGSRPSVLTSHRVEFVKSEENQGGIGICWDFWNLHPTGRWRWKGRLIEALNSIVGIRLGQTLSVIRYWC